MHRALLIQIAASVAIQPPPMAFKDLAALVASAVVFGSVVIGGYRLGGVTTRMEFTEKNAVDAVNVVLGKLDKIGEFIDRSMQLRQEWTAKAANWDACDKEHDERLKDHAKTLDTLRERTHSLSQSIQTAMNAHELLDQRVGQMDRRSGDPDRRHE